MISSAEQTILDAVNLDTPWELIERFTTLKREDPGDVSQAASLIAERLTRHGVPVEIHRPELFLSIPRSASVTMGGVTLFAKAMAMSAIFPQGLSAPLVYQPSGYALDADELFSRQTPGEELDVRGKIVVSEGFGMPGKVSDLERRGALAVIAINPGKRAHWGVCTTIWGSPDLYDLPRKPEVAVVNVNAEDGQRLIEWARSGDEVTLTTDLNEGWFESPVPVVTIPGTRGAGEIRAAPRTLRFLGLRHRRQRGGRRHAAGNRPGAVGAPGQAPAQCQDRVVAGTFHRPLCGQHVVLGRLRAGAERELHCADQLRFSRLPLGHRVSGREPDA